MADVNKVILIGRLTRDPETRAFSNGGRVANFGFAVGSRRFNQQTNQWEDGETMFLDCEAFNRGEYGKLADRVEQYLRKGHQVYLEGRLRLDQWDDKQTGAKRSKHKLVVEHMQMLESRGGDGQGRPPQRAAAGADSYNDGYGESEPAPAPQSGSGDEIPF